MTRTIGKTIICIVAAVIVAGCASEDNTASIVEAYLQAIVNDDVERLAELTCAEAEADAITAATSFRGTDAEIQGMQCRISEANEGYNIIDCQGKIAVSYQAELREFPLGRYRVIQTGDVWRVCGEA